MLFAYSRVLVLTNQTFTFTIPYFCAISMNQKKFHFFRTSLLNFLYNITHTWVGYLSRYRN